MDLQHYKDHMAITEQGIGTIHVMLKNGNHEQALIEIEKTIAELDERDQYYSEFGSRAMRKVVENHRDWKKEGGLYRNWKYGVRNLEEAFKLITQK